MDLFRRVLEVKGSLMDEFKSLVFEVVCIFFLYYIFSVFYVICLGKDVGICKVIFFCSLSKLDIVLVLRCEVKGLFKDSIYYGCMVKDLVKNNENFLCLF